MNRAPYIVANFFAAVVLVLLLIDPGRCMTPIFVLLALAVMCAVLPSFLRR